MKKFTFKGVLDGFRSSVQAAPRGPEQEIQETLRPEHFQVRKTFRHGFPFSPTAIAWDPIQKLLAIGDKAGNLRILGGPGVEAHVRHEGGEAVLFCRFLVNEGALVTATADDRLNLWSFRQQAPHLLHSLKFTRERITCLHLPLQSRWLFVGTERGNVHVVNIETFQLSGYVINWNKAIEVTRPNHPGAVVQVCDNPLDENKLLIAFESGLVVVWDQKARQAEWRGGGGEGLRAAVWTQDSKVMTAHTDGALATWTLRSPRPVSVVYPHAKATKDGKLEPCKPIHKLEWKISKSGESFIVFSGGLPCSLEKAGRGGRTHSLTVLNGKSTVVLELEHAVLDFVTLADSPWAAEFAEPYAVAVLLQNDLVMVDLVSAGYPCFENPYAMDIHESPVTCCTYIADCPSDLIPAFYSVGRAGAASKRGGAAGGGGGAGGGGAGGTGAGPGGGGGAASCFSDKKWPVDGGEWAPACCSYSEIILTGHADGSVKFWDASAGSLQILYKLKCSKVFERRGGGGAAGGGGVGEDEFPLGVHAVSLCPESRRLALALHSSHVVLFKFRKNETVSETHAINVPVISEGADDEGSPEEGAPYTGEPERERERERRSASVGEAGGLRVRGCAGAGAGGGVRKAAGFQAQLVCLQPAPAPPQPPQALTINSSYGLMAWGVERGVVVVDIVRRCVVLAAAASQLYAAAPAPALAHAADPPTRHQRSPSFDQLEDNTPAATPAAMPTPTPAPAQDPTPNDEPAHEDKTKVEGRRKSTAWKGIGNLKRQLSRVDIKLKNAFTNPNDKKEEIDDSRGNTHFYSNEINVTADEKDVQRPETIPGSPDSEPETAEEAREDIDRSRNSSPMKVGAEAYDRMHKELKDKWREEDEAVIDTVAPDLSPSKLTNPLVRPDNLPLFEDDETPVRPPRQNKKPKDDGSKRDQRLLSVPNIRYAKQDVKELRKRQSCSQMPPTFAGNIMRRFKPTVSQNQVSVEYLHVVQPNVNNLKVSFPPAGRIDKLDSSFSRSRSSSMSSLENIASEGIQCLAFADSYTTKSDPSALVPTLWIGTTLGSVFTIMINLPESDLRYSQPVAVTMSGGPVFRLKGSILTMSFLDCNGALIPYPYESWRDGNKESRGGGGGGRDRTPTKQGSSGSSRVSPTLDRADRAERAGDREPLDRQFVVVASERAARVLALPSHTCVYRRQLAHDADFVVKAEIISMKDSVCLVSYASTGHLAAHSLPSLRPLLHVDFLPLADLSFQTQGKQRGIVDPMLSIWGQQLIVNEDTDQIARTFCFSNRGHGLYLASPTELQKFTIDADFCAQLDELVRELFLARDMPEPPRESFFRGLFGGGARPVDRDELFGEASGRPNRTVAKVVGGAGAGAGAVEQLGGRASSAASEVSRAHQLVLERGERLSHLEERTERMHNQAEQFGSSAHQLMLKYKDKKWYQL